MSILLLIKGVPLLAFPLGAVTVCGVVALTLSFTKWWPIGAGLFGFAFVVLWIAATPVFANWLNWRLESPFQPANVETLPQSDVAVLLGGASEIQIVRLARIHHDGKAPIIVISGGNPP